MTAFADCTTQALQTIKYDITGMLCAVFNLTHLKYDCLNVLYPSFHNHPNV